MFNDDGVAQAMQQSETGGEIVKLRHEMSKMGRDLMELRQIVLGGHPPRSDRPPWFPKDAMPEADVHFSKPAAEASLREEVAALKRQQLAAQDARDRLAETSALMLAALCDYHGIEQRGGAGAQIITQQQVGDLRRATGRDVVAGGRQ